MDPIDISLLPEGTRLDGDGGLVVGGRDLLGLAAEFGTPMFLYDEDDLRLRMEEARGVFGPGVAYATKAFLCRAVARLAYDTGMSLDVATPGEYHVCRAAGVPADHLVLHGNNKSRGYVRDAIAEGVQWIVVDGFDDLALISAEAAAQRTVVPVLLRINPGVEVHTHRFIATGNRESKFGLPLWTGDAEKALKLVLDDRWLDLKGVHIHIGSLVFTTENYRTALTYVTDFVSSVGAEYFVIGGGLGVRYLNTDAAPSLTEWGTSVLGYCREQGITGRVLAEPGRSIAARAAVTLYTVGSVATKGDITYVAVDGGMSDNPRPLLYESGYEVFLARSPLAERDRRVHVVGSHCESGDTLVRDGWLPADTTVGDVICTPVTGAYGYSMSSNYNKMPRPPIVFVRDGQAREVVRRETFDDLLRLDLD